MRYIHRSLEPVIRKAVKEFPVVVLTGPRQSGKTTLLKHLFVDSHKYLSVEPPDVRAAAVNDPRSFLEIYSPPMIFDEIQNAPDLLAYIKEKVDSNRSQPGQYILTGSQNLSMMEKVTESLAGRAAILRLLPLSEREKYENPLKKLPWERSSGRYPASILSYKELWASFLRGNFPELTANPKRNISLWYGSYIQTYLERDVRSLRQIGDLTLFQNFLHALAARSAQLFQVTDLARDLGVAVNTVKAWISILEATHQIVILRPYFANIGKRLVKSPKIYFSDVGMLCYLCGIKKAEHAISGPLAGAIFETAVVSELYKTYLHRGVEPQIHFWRASTGMEVDLLIEDQTEWIAVEVKASSTPRPEMAKSLHSLQRTLGDKIGKSYLIHSGDIHLPLGEGVVALPFCDL